MKEIERKFLIRFPDKAILLREYGAEISHITQTYLLSEKGGTNRVRCRIYPNGTRYTHTQKRFISAIANEETEIVIDEKDYLSLLEQADPERQPIEKDRICIPYRNRILEIDLYPFWSHQAILEIELDAEDATYEIPPYLSLIREVTGERAYKNKALAKTIPPEDPFPG